MARPYKPIALSTGKISKEEKERRLNAENKLKGNDDRLHKPPKWLSKSGKKKYKELVSDLEVTGMLCNFDIGRLATYCNAQARYEEIEVQLQTTFGEERKDLLKEKKDIYTIIKDSETVFGLNPSSRARLASMQVEKQEQAEDPFLKALAKLNNR